MNEEPGMEHRDDNSSIGQYPLPALGGQTKRPWPRWARLAAWILILAGMFVRFVGYTSDRQLWNDEAALALNIMERSALELASPLDYCQAAPIGFLVLVKLSESLLGSGERALRLIPLVAGLGCLPLFYLVVRRLLNWPAGLTALGILCLSYRSVYYASELKQYGFDLLVTCILLLLWEHFLWRKPARMTFIFFTGVGAVVVWFSHPSAFVLAGLGIGLGCWRFAGKDYAQVRAIVIMSGIWLLSFAVNYVLISRHLAVGDGFHNFWAEAGAFMPSSPTSFSELEWFRDSYFRLFNRPVGLGYREIGGLAFLIGAVAVWWRSRVVALSLLLPILITLIVSGFHAYPFMDRLLLFLNPILILVIAFAIEGLLESRTRVSAAAAIVIILLLAQPLVTTSCMRSLRPTDKHNVKDRYVLSRIRPELRSDDRIHAFGLSPQTLRYYAYRMDIDRSVLTPHRKWGRSGPVPIVVESGQRIWLLFSACSPAQIDDVLGKLGVPKARTESLTSGDPAILLYTSE